MLFGPRRGPSVGARRSAQEDRGASGGPRDARRLVRSERPAAESTDEALSEELSSTETPTDDVGWSPVWIEDIAYGRFTPEVVEAAESQEACGCASRLEPAESEAAETSDAWTTDEDEDEPLEDDEPAPEPIEAPFGWEDVRDALDVIEDREERT